MEYTTEFDQIAYGAGGNKYITAIAAIVFLFVYFNFAAAAGGNFYLAAVINILPRLPRLFSSVYFNFAAAVGGNFYLPAVIIILPRLSRLFSSMFISTLPPPPAVISIYRR